MPAIIAVVELIFILCVFRYDPITFCVSKGFEEEGKLHMQKVYRKKDPASNETIDEILASQYTYFRKNTTTDASTTTFGQAACGPKYRRSTWVCFFLTTFNAQSGIDAVNIYANRLLV